MSDPVFREQAEALASLLEKDEYRDAFATALQAQEIVKEAQKIAKELRGQQDATTDDEMPGLKDTRDDEQPVRDPGIWMQTVEDTLQTREYVLAAGEKRPAGNDAPDAKRVAGDARERQPTTALDEIRMRRKVAAAHAPAEVDHLREVGGDMKVVQGRSGRQNIIHHCTHPATTDPDRTCACCFAGGAYDVAHKRNPNRECPDGLWHTDIVSMVCDWHTIGTD